MFADFSTLKKKPTPNELMPQMALEEMNQNLPVGLQYVLDNAGNITVMPVKNSNITIGGFKFKVTSVDKKILGEHYSNADVLNYSYNAQKPMELILEQEGFLKVNGNKISTKDFVQSVYHKIEYERSKWIMYPPEFPEATPYELASADGKHKKTVFIRRIANNSLSEYKYESDKEMSLYITLSYDNSSLDINGLVKTNFTVNMQLNKAKDLEEMIDVLWIIHDFSEGTAKIPGLRFNKEAVKNNNERLVNLVTVNLYEKLFKISKELNITFDPKDIRIDDTSIETIESLYHTLILKKPIKRNTIIRSVEYEGSSNAQNSSVNENIGKNIALQINAVRELELFKKTIELQEIIASFDICIKNIEQNDDGSMKANIDNFSPEEPGYSAYLWFKNTQSLTDYFDSNDSHRTLEEFKNAKNVFEYIKEEQVAMGLSIG